MINEQEFVVSTTETTRFQFLEKRSKIKTKIERTFICVLVFRTIMSANQFGPIMSGPLCPRAHYIWPIMSAGPIMSARPLCPAHYVCGTIMSSPVCPRAQYVRVPIMSGPLRPLVPLWRLVKAHTATPEKKTAHGIASGETTTAFTSPFQALDLL